jgi:zinc protease
MRLSVLLLGLALSAPAQAAPIDLDVQDYTLPNGLRVVLSVDRTAPTVGVAIYYDVGSRDEAAGQTGYAHLVEHLAFQGSANLGRFEHVARIREAGGTSSAFTHPDATAFFEEVPSHHLERVLWMEADRMRAPLTEERFVAAKGAILAERRKRPRAEPGVMPPGAAERLNELAYSGFAYGHPIGGTPADLESATLAKLEAFRKAHYFPSTAVLAVAGDFEAAQAKGWIEKYFGALPKQGAPKAPKLDEPEQTKEKSDTLKTPEARAEMVAMAFHVPPAHSADWYALDLLGAAVGAGDAGRLVDKLGSDAKVASSVHAGIDLDFLRGPGLLDVVATTAVNHHADELKGKLDDELKRLRESGVTARELQRAKARVASAFVNDLATHVGRARSLAEYALLWGDPRKLRDEVEHYQGVTAADVSRVAAKYLGAGNRTTLTILPSESPAPAPSVTPAAPPAASSTGAPAPSSIEQPPPLGTPKEPVFPKVELAKLPNGLEVAVVERHALPTVEVMLVLTGAGTAADPDDRAGLATLVASLLHEGTRERGRDQLEEAIELAGGDLASVVSRDATVLQAQVLAGQVDAALSLIAEVTTAPALSAQALDELRLRALDELTDASADPEFIASGTAAHLVFGAHPYARVAPTKASLLAITRDDVVHFHGDRYRPGAARLILVGDISAKEATAKAKRFFGSWRAGKTAAPLAAPTAPAATEKTTIHLVAPANPGEPAVRITMLGPRPADPDYLPLVVAQQLLGGPWRRPLPWHAGFDPLAQGSSFFVAMRAPGDRATALLGSLLAEMARLGKEGPTGEPLATAKGYLSALLAQQLEEPAALAHLLALARTDGLPADAWSHFASDLAKLDAARVTQAVQRWLDPKRAAIVVVGGKSLAPALSSLGRVIE